MFFLYPASQHLIFFLTLREAMFARIVLYKVSTVIVSRLFSKNDRRFFDTRDITAGCPSSRGKFFRQVTRCVDRRWVERVAGASIRQLRARLGLRGFRNKSALETQLAIRDKPFPASKELILAAEDLTFQVTERPLECVKELTKFNLCGMLARPIMLGL